MPRIKIVDLPKYQEDGQVKNKGKNLVPHLALLLNYKPLEEARQKALDYSNEWYNSPMYKKNFEEMLSPGEEWMGPARMEQLRKANEDIIWGYGRGPYLGETTKHKGEPSRIYLNTVAHAHDPSNQSLDATGVHEVGHVVSNIGKLIPQKVYDLMKSYRPTDYNLPPGYDRKSKDFKNLEYLRDYYLGSTPEKFDMRAADEFGQLIKSAKQEGKEANIGYDPFTQEFTPEMYDKYEQLLKDPKFKKSNFSMLKAFGLSKEAIIDLFNKSVAKNDGAKEMNTARDGGFLFRFDEGGDTTPMCKDSFGNPIVCPPGYSAGSIVFATSSPAVKDNTRVVNTTSNEQQLGAQAVSSANAFNKGWMNSPMYNQMLQTSMAASPTSDSDIPKLRKIAANPSSVDIKVKDLNNPNLGGTTEYIPYVPGGKLTRVTLNSSSDIPLDESASHEIAGHATDYGGTLIPQADKDKIDRYFTPTDKGIGIVNEDPITEIAKANNISYEKQKAIIDERVKNDPEFAKEWKKNLDIYRKAIEKNNKSVENANKQDNYIKGNSETRGRMMSVRKTAKERNIYDPFTQKMTRENLRQLKKLNNDQLNSLFENYTEDELLDMFNTISMNESSDNMTVAKIGGLTRYQDGGEPTSKDYPDYRTYKTAWDKWMAGQSAPNVEGYTEAPIQDVVSEVKKSVSVPSTSQATKQPYTGVSIVDYLKSRGYSSDRQFRSDLAQRYGVQSYVDDTGYISGNKNLELLSDIRANDDILEQINPTYLPITPKETPINNKGVNTPKALPAVKDKSETVNPGVLNLMFNTDFKIPTTFNKVNTKPQYKSITGGGKKVVITSTPESNSLAGYTSLTSKGKNLANWKTPVVQDVPIATTPWEINPLNPLSGIKSPVTLPVVKQQTTTPPKTRKGLAEGLTNNKLLSSTETPDTDLKKINNDIGWEDVVNLFNNNPSLALKIVTKIANNPTYKDVSSKFQEASSIFKEKGLSGLLDAYKTKKARVASLSKGDDLNSINKVDINSQAADNSLPIVFGDPIYDTDKSRILKNGQKYYHSSAYIDLNKTKWGYINRQGRPSTEKNGSTETAGLFITPFAKEYSSGSKDWNSTGDDFLGTKSIRKYKDSEINNNSVYGGIDDDGNFHLGYGKDMKGKNLTMSDFRYTDTEGFIKDANGNYKLGDETDNSSFAKVPHVKTDKGETHIPFLVPTKGSNQHLTYGENTGGKIIITTPDFKQKVLVAGSLAEVDKAIEKFKAKYKLNKVRLIVLDNGTYSRGIMKTGNKFTSGDWKTYQSNSKGGAGFYLRGRGYKEGGNITSSEGYINNAPPEGYNYRIPSDTLFNPTPYTIQAVSDNGIVKTLPAYDTSRVQFPGAQYVDEFHQGQDEDALRNFYENQVKQKSGKNQTNSMVNREKKVKLEYKLKYKIE